MVVAIGSWSWDDAACELRRGDERLALTRLERSLVGYLARRAGQTVSRADLLRDVWEYAPTARTRAVVNAVARLRAKLGTDGAWLVNVYGQGYRLDVADDPDLIRREAALGAVRDTLAEHRQVTIHGIGGVGKTRLARAVVRGRQSTLWVPLAGVTSPRG